MRNILGAIHIHSNYSSDGKNSLIELKRFFMDENIHFICLSDHIEDLESARYKRLIEECRIHSDDKFIIFPGVEIEGKCLLIIGIDNLEDFEKFKNNDFTNQKKYFTVLAHPHKLSRRKLGELTRGNNKIFPEAIEVLNIKYDGRHLSSPAGIREFLRNKNRIKPIFGLDLHEIKDFVGMLVSIKDPEFSYKGIISALKNGNYQIVAEGKEFHIPEIVPLAFYIRLYFFHTVNLFLSLVNRFVKKIGIKIPEKIKRKLKKAI